MKAMFLLTFRQFIRGGARTWFTWICAVICAGILGAVLFGGESLAAVFEQQSDLARPVLFLSRLVMVLLILGLSMLLRNVFRLSLSQRTRMLGQLASLGATRRQMRQSVWLEALILGACSIPLGLAAAAAGLAIVFSVLRNVQSVAARPLTLMIRPQHILLAAACVLFTLFLAAWGTARRASKLTAIEAVRETYAIPKCHGTSRFQNIARLIAARSSSAYHYGTSQTAVVAICVFLVLMTLGFSDGMIRSYIDNIPEYNYRIYFWVRGGHEPADLDQCVRDAVKRVEGGRVYSSEDTGLIWYKENNAAKILTLDDAAFKEWYGAELPSSPAGTLSCIYAANADQTPLFEPGERSSDGTCVVTDTCDTPLPVGLQEQNGFPCSYFITTQSAYDSFPGRLQRTERLLQILVETQDATRLTPEITQTLEGVAIQETNLSLLGSDTTAYMIQDFTQTSWSYTMTFAAVGLLRICGWGFVVLLTVGCTASVLSSASAQAQMRRREFAILRSAGMTQRELSRMLGMEARRRCLVGLGFGLPTGIAVSFFVQKWLITFYKFYWLECLWISFRTGLVVAVGAIFVCWAAHRVALKAAFSATIRDDLMRE
ncbi:FtsX-like permease family protein [uncultured Ruthenibacterium sp.]|uniref:FtsX-like permease family protein n=1 Tax=uncultured Ruthenibacterium sp. TaxID=1905347 RepID=UPI00349E6494